MMKETAIIINVILAVVVFAVPRKYLLVAFVLVMSFALPDQRLIIFGLDFTVGRLLLVAGILWILLYGERRCIKWNRFEKLVFAWVISGSMVNVAQWTSSYLKVRTLELLVRLCFQESIGKFSPENELR